MRRTLVGFSLCLVAVALWAHAPGQDATSVELGKGKVTITYGTPSLGGRNLDEMIVPGMAWRMGMNSPTTLETTVGLEFFGKKLPAGKYALFARPDEHKNWTLLASTGMQSVLDPATVVLEAPLEFSRDDAPQEVLKITLSHQANRALLLVAWGTYRLRTSFRAI